VHEAHIARELEAVWHEDQSDSIEGKKDRPREPFITRLGQGIARLGSPLL